MPLKWFHYTREKSGLSTDDAAHIVELTANRLKGRWGKFLVFLPRCSNHKESAVKINSHDETGLHKLLAEPPFSQEGFLQLTGR